YTNEQKVYNTDTMVSVICTTYNHEKFIEQALESMANQKTNFKYEILVGDDCSTDKTASIVEKLYQKYPDIIVPVLRKSNIGPKENHLDLFNRAKGKYIALNEGDDYWTDFNKLQMQVDYMEKHEECSVCFHPVEVIDENNFKSKNIYPPNIDGNKFTFEKLLNSNLIQTNSVIYRNNIFKNYIIHPLLMPGDWFRHLKNAMYGEIHMIPRVMSAYRKHDGGIWSGMDFFHRANNIGQLIFFSELKKEADERFHPMLAKQQIRNFKNLYWYYFERNDLNQIYKLIDVNRGIANLFFKKYCIQIDAFTIKNEQQLLKKYKEIYKVDVVITSYNHEKYIAQTLNSVV
ncbi:MAG: glycosyltransferase, partial [Campylobacterales bacterium]|nr:glycosyltransferase [Campylobacterales bacterium]